MSTGLVRSIQTRLVQHAHDLRMDPNHVLARYGTERMLYRLSRCAHAERFVLKGALLLLVWLGETIRPTRDADLLGVGEIDAAALARIFAEICVVPVEADGLDFDASSIRVAPIRPEDAYGGQRVTLVAHLGAARLRVQVDVGSGDAVVPDPEWLEYPSLLDLPRPRLRAYLPPTTIAEKLHAMVVLGSKNSRMRDFFDVHALASRHAFEGATLAAAIAATFARRRTEVPGELPFALTPAFAAIDGKAAQWAAFARRLQEPSSAAALGPVIERIATFAGPVLDAAHSGERITARWQPGGPWRLPDPLSQATP